MAKATVKKCECGRVTNPVHIEIVRDAWIKNDKVHYEFKCPQCKKINVIVQDYEE